MNSFCPWLPKYLGLGTFPLASPFKPVLPDVALEIVKTFLRRGGKYIDTAPTYAFGETARLLGQALKDIPRGDFVINTSCGWVRDGDGYRLSGRATDVRRDFEASLERLCLDYVDVYISHFPDPAIPFCETMAEMEKIRSEGLAKHLGVANVSLEQLREYCNHGKVEVVQNRFSMINRSLSEEFLDFCSEKKIGIVAYQSIERGLLTDRDYAETKPMNNDLRARKPEFADGPREIIKKWVEDMIIPIARREKCTTAALSMAWTLSHPGVAVVQCGASTLAQLDTFDEARRIAVSIGLRNEIDEAYGILCERVLQAGYESVRTMMGIGGPDPLKGLSASGR